MVVQLIIPEKAETQEPLIEMDSRFRGNDGLSRGVCPDFHRPEIAT